MSPWGDALAEADEKEAIHVVDIDLSMIAEMRANLPYLSKKRPEIYAQTN
jgi:predicted amidohydrolase